MRIAPNSTPSSESRENPNRATSSRFDALGARGFCGEREEPAFPRHAGQPRRESAAASLVESDSALVPGAPTPLWSAPDGERVTVALPVSEPPGVGGA